jgi:hypothetical protein
MAAVMTIATTTTCPSLRVIIKHNSTTTIFRASCISSGNNRLRWFRDFVGQPMDSSVVQAKPLRPRCQEDTAFHGQVGVYDTMANTAVVHVCSRQEPVEVLPNHIMKSCAGPVDGPGERSERPR